jgi:cell cycle sensor histidine kinase DivJ
LASPKSVDWIAGLTAGCERFVHPSLVDPIARDRRARFAGVVIAAPFFGFAAFALASYGGMSAAMVAAALCALCGICWSAALLVAINVRRELLEGAALALAAAFAVPVLASSGGLASPMSAAVFALAFEAWWIGRSRRAVIAGMAATFSVFIVQVPAGIFFAPAGASASQWLVPLAYGLTVWMRLRALFIAAKAAAPTETEPPLEERIDAVMVRISGNGDVAGVSGHTRRLFRLAPELLLGVGLFDRIHVADRVAYLCALSDVREKGARGRAEIRLRVPEVEGAGAGFHSYMVELFPSGEGRDVAALIRDNSEMAALKAELAAAAEQANSNEVAKNRFLAAVSHELRTPLNAILGFSDMLTHEMFGPFADPRQKEYVGLIQESGNHLFSVVNSILDVSKIEAGAYPIRPEPFGFADAVETCRSMMAHQASTKPVSLRVALAPGVGEVCADRRAVQQILINLLSNAVKFTPAGGSVVMGAKRTGKQLRFWVSDTGIGISPDDLKRLGRPFTQIQNDYTRQFEGAGLGLSLVKGLVVLHDGTMAIESAPGDGTTVTITVPIAGPHSAATPADEDDAASDYLMDGTGDGTQRKTA